MASLQATAPTPTSVYRYYDAMGMLIYVGITKQGMDRNSQHNGKAEWWPLVARQEVDHLPSRPAAMLREKELIRSHRPPFNKQHNPTHAEARAVYLSYAVQFSHTKLRTPVEVFREVGKRLPLDIVALEPRQLILRSRLEHGPLASLLVKDVQAPAVRGHRRQYGCVDTITQSGPTVLLTCLLRSAKKVTPPEGGIASADAMIGWDNKQQRPALKQVLVTEGDLAGVTF